MVRLLKKFRFDCSEVFIRKKGNEVILSQKPKSWEEFFRSPDRSTDDFMAERAELLEKRDLFG